MSIPGTPRREGNPLGRVSAEMRVLSLSSERLAQLLARLKHEYNMNMNATDTKQAVTNTTPHYGTLEVSAQKGTEIVKVKVDLDKLEVLLQEPGVFRNFVEMASTAAFHRNGEGWKKAKTMSGEGWLIYSATPTVRVIQDDKDKAAAQFGKVWQVLGGQDEKARAAFYAASGLEPFTDEAGMAVSFALQRAAIAARVAAETLAAKQAQADALASLLAPKGGDK